jgi:hypothetical protein
VAARAVTLGACGQAGGAVLRVARETGVPAGSRQVWPDSAATVHYAGPAAGLRIARALEHAAVRVAGDYLRHARVDGVWWHEIGGALGPGPDARERGQAIGEAAFGYAAGESSLSGRASFGWTCPACGQSVTGRGPYEPNPQDYQGGHAGGCARLAAGVGSLPRLAGRGGLRRPSLCQRGRDPRRPGGAAVPGQIRSRQACSKRRPAPGHVDRRHHPE